MCVYTYTYKQLTLHNWVACSADSARLILELEVQNRQAGKENGQKMGETKNGHPRTCPRRVSNTLFMGNISSCCCCCCVASVMSDSCDPRDDSPPGSPVPGILQARTQEWVAISFSNA